MKKVPVFPLWNKLALLALLGLAAALYFASLSLYVQGGDTGELVAAAYRGLVAHPPGYPLWIWLERAWVHAVPFSSVFWRASLLCSLFALGALALLGFSLRKVVPAFLLCLPVLALSRAFLEAALLPDVFSLHALFLAAIGGLFLFRRKKDDVITCFGLPFLFFLSLANHLTAVFLFPVLGCVLWQIRGDPRARRAFFFGCLAGITCFAALYASLGLLQPAHPYSWGELHSPGAILAHLLRMDYGTFRLSATSGAASFAPFLHFAGSSLLEIAPLLVFALWLMRSRRWSDPRLLAWAACCLLCVLFLLALNISPEKAGAETLLRFHLMPVVLLVFLSAYVLAQGKARELWIGCALVLPVSLFLLRPALQSPRLRNDSLIEDYALNLLGQAERRQPALLLTEGDTTFFALRYAQLVLGASPGSLVVSPSLLFHPWYYAKIRQRWPDFQLPDAGRIHSSRELDFEADLVLPNRQAFTIFVSRGFRQRPNWKLTFLALGRSLSAGEGTEFDSASEGLLRLRTSYAGRAARFHSFSKKALVAQYSHYYLGRGLARYAAGDKEKAASDWARALELVPFAYPALSNLCRSQGGGYCRAEDWERAEAEAEGLF